MSATVVYQIFRHTTRSPSDSNSAIESCGLFSKFETACKAARRQLSNGTYANRDKDYANLYEEWYAGEACSLSSEGFFVNEPRDCGQHESEFFCIRAVTGYGETEKIWVRRVTVQDEEEPYSSSHAAANAPVTLDQITSNTITADSKTADDTCSPCKAEEGDVTIYHTIRVHEIVDRGYPFSYKTILGTFRNFKDARKAARKELLFAIDAYSVYVEGGVGDSHDYHDNEKPLVKFKPKDALDEDFCIYAEDEYGNSERNWVQKGTLHAPSEPREDSDDEDDVDADIGQDRSPEEAVSNTSIGAEGALPKRRFADTTMSDHDRYESSKRSKDDGVYKEQERVRMISPSYFD